MLTRIRTRQTRPTPDDPRDRGLDLVLLGAAYSALLACTPATQEGQRWYTQEQVRQGRDLYTMHCVTCHGEAGVGTQDWRSVGPDGAYPPPPLNGTAHTWHHPLAALDRTIAQGGQALGGVMPGFADQLDRDARRATIAYIQSTWSDAVYAQWRERNRAQGATP